ncbi:Lrp/AsnC family transcriptional regulator [Acinetobacter sp. MD2]|uniref:Lrp/AsnC family transcriptional regulator n=1 Tax=Acinetobacter sp. MD2 TaxID=2600066 RepID=UPI002D1E5E6D|nr:Lrp/AsnC ligand binding domain-containing protein [Acinetobacter sp. MD2]MEB3768073.1 Lrp/AsnC ligand binding domain-containing protein [Acinetobacter sp. MD2]
MGENKLSALDLKIMRALQQDGRLSNAELAKLVGISSTSCWNHTQRLFKIGAILNIRASINPQMVQRDTIVLVGVVLDRSTPESFAAFEVAAKALNQVLECYLVAGEFDYFLKIRIQDLSAFNQLHSEKLIALPGVRQVRTFFVLNEIKSNGILVF